MPFWPFYMVAAAALSVWGYRSGAWLAPVLTLSGLIGMRVIIWGLDPALFEIAACTLWLCIGAALMYKGAWVPGFFVTISGLSYAALMLAGFRIEYLGFLQIIADVLFWLAMLSIGGGLLASSRNFGAGNLGFLDRFVVATLGVAARQARDCVTVAKHPEMIYDTR